MAGQRSDRLKHLFDPKPQKAAADDVDLSRPVQLVALAVKDGAARCRLPGTDKDITLRVPGYWKAVPGTIVTVKPRKMWLCAGHPYLSGELLSTRIDVAAIGLEPLGLEHMGTWDPADEYWGEEGEPIPEYARPIIARGPCPGYEMEQVLPGEDSDDPWDDPILESTDLKAAGDFQGALRILMGLCQADLRCLDAHAHLGNLLFDRPREAVIHYEVGVRIGELSLGRGFSGVLLWGWVDNRPFLRCLHGYGLSLWRLGRFDQAERVFDRMLWLNPPDNQKASFIIDDVRDGKPWRPDL